VLGSVGVVEADVAARAAFLSLLGKATDNGMPLAIGSANRAHPPLAPKMPTRVESAADRTSKTGQFTAHERRSRNTMVAVTVRQPYSPAVSTVAEIENALEQLPTEQMLAVAVWLDERRAMLSASEAMFRQLDEAEGKDAGNQWLGE